MKQMMLRSALAFVILSVLIVQSINACHWDRDTLAMEAENFPGITEIITGRFDRFPALYYEMRLERVTEELGSDPDNLDLYDDAGVACDRIGRHDEAIGWMAKKRAVLDALDEQDAEHEYRYLANLGTFHIHRWLSSGANREDLSDVELSRDLIAQAIELNPDAHFGRERYQLLAIEWILKLDDPAVPAILFGADPEYTSTHDWSFSLGPRNPQLEALGYKDAVEGLSGLIVLGHAWGSIDVFRALQSALKDQGHSSLAYLCQLRISELIDQGNRSLHDAFPYENYEDEALASDDNMVNSKELRIDYYPQVRAESRYWHDEKLAFMESMLNTGSHPDTDDAFWDGWQESTSPPEPPGDGFADHNPFFMAFLVLIGGFVLLVTLTSAVIFWLLKRLRTQPA